MSITSALQSASSGLRAQAERADVAAGNVANASTPGYVRRDAILAERLTGTQTTGVDATGVQRSEDTRLVAERRALSADGAQNAATSELWGRIATRFGNSVEGSGLFKAYSDLDTALTQASANPQSTPALQRVLSSAAEVTAQFRQIAEMFQAERQRADTDIADTVARANGLLESVVALNTDIAASREGSAQRAALTDERQRALDGLAEIVPVTVVERERGVVDIFTREGVLLLDRVARPITFTPTSAINASMSLSAGSLSGLSVGGQDITPGAPTWGAVSGGRFGALFAARDTLVPDAAQALDALAGDLIARFDDPAADPTRAPGQAGLFVATATPGASLAQGLAVNPLADPEAGGELRRLRDGLGAATPGPVGDSSILVAMSQAFARQGSVTLGGVTLSASASGGVAALASQFTETRTRTEAANLSTITQLGVVRDAEARVSGVDIDEEMKTLLLIEQSYAANARVIEVAAQMLDRLMAI